MIIVNSKGGIGNQLFQYAAGRRLAYKLNTSLKLDKVRCSRPYALHFFNVQESFATPEEVIATKRFDERGGFRFMPQALELPDNTYLRGYWENERYFADIADIIRKEFMLKNPLSPVAEVWRQKILSAGCAVSMHFRHGDFLKLGHLQQFAVPLLEYYLKALNQLAEPKSTVFVFSDDLPWCKENLKLDVPTEFVEGCQDYEDLHLISLCKHNINANSTFSWWGAWLNQNPDKKVFVPIPNTFFDINRLYRGFTPTHYKYSSLDSERWVRVPFNMNKRLNNLLPPDYRNFYTAANLDAHDISNINLTLL